MVKAYGLTRFSPVTEAGKYKVFKAGDSANLILTRLLAPIARKFSSF